MKNFRLVNKIREPLGIGQVMLETVVVLAILFCGLKAFGQDTVPVAGLNDGIFKTVVTGGGVATLTGADDASITPTIWVDTELPLGIFVPFARVGITSRPGENVDLTSVDTFKDAEVGLGVKRYFASSKDGTAKVGFVAEAGWSSALPQEPRPLDQLSKYGGVGVVFSHVRSGAGITGLWGYDESAGDFGKGKLMVYGSLPIEATGDAIILTGEATISLASRATTPNVRDVFKLGVALDLGKVVNMIAKASDE